MEDTEKITGTVKWFNPTLGYGFILPDEPTKENQEVFVHFNAIQMEGYKKLKKSERVRFILVNNDGSDQAQDVERLEEHDQPIDQSIDQQIGQVETTEETTGTAE